MHFTLSHFIAFQGGVTILRHGCLYESAPKYVTDQPFFLNSAIEVHSVWVCRLAGAKAAMTHESIDIHTSQFCLQIDSELLGDSKTAMKLCCCVNVM